MQELMDWMEYIEDVRQVGKVCHKLKDILVIVLFATLADADDWVEIAMFAQVHQEYLRKYIELENKKAFVKGDFTQTMKSPKQTRIKYISWQENEYHDSPNTYQQAENATKSCAKKV